MKHTAKSYHMDPDANLAEQQRLADLVEALDEEEQARHTDREPLARLRRSFGTAE